ncbi:MAG TPA: DUF2007 domain-containing protein [Sphingomicrobium sp.]
MSDVVEVARFNRAFQADLCRMFLESNGIQAVVFDAQSNVYSEGATVGVRVMVLDEDLDEASQVLRDYRP